MTVNIVLTTIGANISNLKVECSSDGINYSLLHASIPKSSFLSPGLNVVVPAGTTHIRVTSVGGVCDDSIDLEIVQCTTTSTTTLAGTTTTTTTVATPTTTTTTTAGDGPTTTTTTTVDGTTTTTTSSSSTTTTSTSSSTTTTTTTSEPTTTTTTTLLIEINCDEDMLMVFWNRQPIEGNTWEAYIELPVPAPLPVDDSYIFTVEFTATRNDVPDTITHQLDVEIKGGEYVGQTFDPDYHIANIIAEDWTVTSYQIVSVVPNDGIFVYEACLTTTTTTTTIGD